MNSEMNENIAFLKETLNANAFPTIEKVIHSIGLQLNIQNNTTEIVDKTLTLKSNIDSSTMEKVPVLVKELKTKVKGGFEIDPDELKQNYIDTPFPVIPQVNPVLNEGDKVDIAPKGGEVTLFDFWATWCPPCQGPMEHNQEMLEKHTDWKGKVRIVGVSFDDEVSTVKERVTSRNWTLVEHYLIPGGFESQTAKHFSIQGIPFCVLVGKDGKIKLTGHPMSMNLDENIQKLVDDLPIPKKGQSPSSKIVDIANLPNEDQAKEFVQSTRTKMKPLLDNATRLKVYLIYGYISEKCENISKGSLKIMMNFYIEDKFKQEIELQQKAINDSTPNINLNFRVNYLTYYTLKDISACSKCNKAIDNEKHYICKECSPPIGLCDQCLSKEEHTHALFVLYPEGKVNLNKLIYYNFTSKLKENFNLEADAIFDDIRCDCCDIAPLKGIRLKCAVCLNVDLCQNCIKAIETPGSDLSSIEEKAKGVGHDLKGHCYIRFLHPDMT